MVRRVWRALIIVGLGLCCFVGIPTLILSGAYSLKYGQCIRLPSGAEIGYEAYVDFGNPYFIPHAVLRTSTGDVIGQEVSPIHVTEKAAFGWAWIDYNNPRSDFTFIWTEKTGVVKESEEPELYLQLSRDLGNDYYGASKEMNTNTLWLLKRLMEDERFQSGGCHTSLVTW